MSNFELLSPAGSMESLRAAVQSGADAVYLGGNLFNARASAFNFTNSELIEAIKYAALRNVKIFVAVNISIKETEIDELVKYTDFLYKAGANAIIISDIGIAYLLRDRYPDMEFHASTQISAHSLNDVLELQKAGFNRIVLARELNIDEIKEICKKADVDIEVFVHGALCICYSGQCFMSSLIGNRSGNRGRCAQSCRQPYKLFNLKTNTEVKNTMGNYLLSPKDLCSFENIDRVLETGLKSLKIEGRMKRSEYVTSVTSAYRNAIDCFNNNSEFLNKSEVKNNLKSVFNRNFTKGYLMHENGLDIMSYNKPNNNGIRLGEVIEYDSKRKKLKIKLTSTLSKGDGLNIGGGNVGRILINGVSKEIAYKDDIIEIDFLKSIKPKTIIYKTFDKVFSDKSNMIIKEDYEGKRITLNAELLVKVGYQIRLKVYDIEVYSDEIIEKSKNTKIRVDDVIVKLSKTKNTPYDFKFDKVEIDIDSFIQVF